MTERSHIKEDDSFRTFLIVSIAIHFALIGGTLIKHWLLPSKTIVIPEAIRVDMVGLPEKIQPPPAPPRVKPPAPAPIVQKKPAPQKANLKAEQQQAFAKLQAMEAIKKMQQQLEQHNTKPQQTPPPKPTYKGNIISSGDSFSGLSRLHVNDYLSAIKKKIHSNWSLPQWLSDSNLKAQVVVTLDSSGAITRSQIYVSSGNSMFDNSCLAAVQQSSPFAPPPAEVRGAVLLIHFPF